jgi:hypothetical protein
VQSIIAIGYPDEKKPPHKKEALKYGQVHHNVYGRMYKTEVLCGNAPGGRIMFCGNI